MDKFRSFIFKHWKKFAVISLLIAAYLADRGVVWAKAITDLFFFFLLLAPIIIILGIIILTILSRLLDSPKTNQL